MHVSLKCEASLNQLAYTAHNTGQYLCNIQTHHTNALKLRHTMPQYKSQIRGQRRKMQYLS